MKTTPYAGSAGSSLSTALAVASAFDPFQTYGLPSPQQAMSPAPIKTGSSSETAAAGAIPVATVDSARRRGGGRRPGRGRKPKADSSHLVTPCVMSRPGDRRCPDAGR